MGMENGCLQNTKKNNINWEMPPCRVLKFQIFWISRGVRNMRGLKSNRRYKKRGRIFTLFVEMGAKIDFPSGLRGG